MKARRICHSCVGLPREAPCAVCDAELERLRDELYEWRLRAENPSFSGRLDSWQAAAGKARTEAKTYLGLLRAMVEAYEHEASPQDTAILAARAAIAKSAV